ncbi:hypothetical protein CAEBREN_25289 [Caenorhabditis brenneri]|uniref:Uncharacterized protein n=1 Tax=Caenorhabditis brenneri TaxID=135651 RepID=G0NBB8_CAEBE|nr:hypothetical protein CAEBREN_25289 [Caenorhabditis brenneri]
MQKELEESAKASIDKTLKDAPTATKAQDQFMTIEEYIQGYGVLLKALFVSEYNKYSEIYKNVLERLFETPSGNILSNTIEEALEQIIEKDNTLKRQIELLEKRLNFRLEGPNKLAETENVQGLYSETYQIVPEWKPMSLTTETIKPKQNPSSSRHYQTIRTRWHAIRRDHGKINCNLQPEKQYDYHWDRLMNIPKAKETAHSLRVLHNELSAILSSLKAYEKIESQNFQSIIRKKIPSSILIDILKSKPTSTTELLNALDAATSIEEAAQRSETLEKQDKSVFTVKKAQPQTQQKTCKFCNRKNHSTVECKTVRTLEDRKEFIKNNNLCFNCMNSGHRLHDCKSNACRKCNTKHNTAICPKNQNIERKSEYQRNKESSAPQFNRNQNTNYQKNNFSKPSYSSNQNTDQRFNQRNSRPINTNWKPNQGTYSPQQQQQKTAQNRNENHRNQGESAPKKNQNKANSYQINSNQTSLIIANAPIVVGDEVTNIPVLLDTGADQSFILAEYADKMNMRVIERNVEINVSVFGKDPSEILYNKVEFEILTNQDNNSIIKVEALTVPDITDLFDPIALSHEDRDYLEKRNEKTVNITRTEKVVALIGCDVFWEIVANPGTKLPSGRIIIPTQIENVICGRNEKSATNTHALIARIKRTKEEEVSETSCRQKKEIIDHFKNTVKINKNTNRVVVTFPWKEGQREKLGNNKEVAYCRLRQQYFAARDKEAWTKLKENFDSMEQNGIIEKIGSHENRNIGYFLPHQFVYNSSSNTTKFRVVFDASSKIRGGISLNNALHQGPSLTPNLIGILLRTRQGHYILIGDIEKAFHMVEVNEQDRDALHEGFRNMENVIIMRFKRLPFGVNCSPFLLSMAIVHGIQQTDAPKELVEAVEQMCYVDNFFITTDDINKLPEYYTSLKHYSNQMGMNMREFSVNSCDDFIRPEDKVKNTDNIKVLGYLYDSKDDTYEVRKRNTESNGNIPIQIAIFTDASEAIYGTCLYLKIPIQERSGQFEIHLLIAKQRIAPKIKTLTIPRLELMGILIGVRLLKYTLSEMNLNPSNIEIFSDSTIALAQIKNQSNIKSEKQPVWVERRCNEIWMTLQNIKEGKPRVEISLSHVPTDQNPADHITRGSESEDELRKTNYFYGPEWLSDNDHPDHPLKKDNGNKIEVLFPEDNIVVTPTVLVTKIKKIPNCDKKPTIKTNSELAKQIIQKIHKEHLHAGPAATLGFVLDKYAGKKWKAAVKRELKRCSVCRKANNHSFRDAPPGDLPIRRTTPCRPFQHIGVDFLGPIKTQVRNSSEILKSQILLITCATTRLIHLELVRDLSTDEFLMALSRFMNRRGCPETITSDNASTFTLASEILDRYAHGEDEFFANLDFEQIDNFRERDAKSKTNILEKEMSKKGIKWYFKKALAPWQGGFCERLVGIVKKALKHALGDSLYKTTNLETLITECESMINRRPITYIDEDCEDCKVLRPIDFYCAGLLFPQNNDKGLDDDYVAYTSQYRKIREQAKRFWHIFYRDYLQQNKNFRSIAQHNRAFSNLVKPVLGEVVLLKDEKTDRKNWKLGIITELITGRDGEIRSVRKSLNQKKLRTNLIQEKLRKIMEKNVNAVSTQQIQNKKIKETPRRPAIRRAPTYIWKYYSMYMMIFMCLLALMSGASARPDSLGSFNFPNRTIPDTEVYTSSTPSIPKRTPSPTTTTEVPKTTTTEAPTTTTVRTSTQGSTPLPTTTRSTTVPTTTTGAQTHAPTTKTATTRSPNKLENTKFETRSSQAEVQQLPSPIVLPPADAAAHDLINDLNPTLQKEVEGNFPKEEGAKRKHIIIEKTCPPTDFCWKLNKYFDCVFCTSFIFNSQCHPKTTITIAILLLIIPIKLIITCFQLGKIWRLTKLICQWIWHIVRKLFCCNRCINRNDSEDEDIEMTTIRNRRTNRHINTITSRLRRSKRSKRESSRPLRESKNKMLEKRRTRTFEVKTVKEDGNDVLKIEKTSSRTPSPSTPSPTLGIVTLAIIIACATIVSADVCDETIPITHDQVTCNDDLCRIEKVEDIFFTPQTKTACIQVVSNKNVITKFKLTVSHNLRKCQKGPNSKLIEFTEGNKYPGRTYCEKSCGGVWCKCLLPTPGCLFYRTYAVPTTDEKFQIYTCESWSNAVSFQTTLTLDNKETDNVFVLSEGDDYQIKFVYGDTHEIINIKIRLLEVTGETGLSIQGKTFIQNKEKVAIAANFNDNFPLECTEDGSCNYRETCRSTTTEKEAQCIFDAPDLYKMIDDHVYNLPVITERYHLGTNLDNVPTLRMKHNKLHVQIIMKQNYNTNILTCDKKGIVNEIHRKFNVSSPKGVCTVVCGNKSNSYKIEGTLTYVSKTSLFEYLNQVFHSEKKVISTVNHQTNIMSKRPHMSITEKVNEKAEEMAVTWQLRAITERAAREMRRPQRPPPRCHFCGAAHQTAECNIIPQGDKMEQAARKRICLICLTHAGHHPANCRGLRTPIQLCNRRCCVNNYIIHHKTICASATPPASPQQSPRNDDENQNHQK